MTVQTRSMIISNPCILRLRFGHPPFRLTIITSARHRFSLDHQLDLSQVSRSHSSQLDPWPATSDWWLADLGSRSPLAIAWASTNNENSVPESCVVSLSNDISGPHPCLSCCKSELSMFSSMPFVSTYSTTSHALDLELGAGIVILVRTGELEGKKFI